MLKQFIATVEVCWCKVCILYL